MSVQLPVFPVNQRTKAPAVPSPLLEHAKPGYRPPGDPASTKVGVWLPAPFICLDIDDHTAEGGHNGWPAAREAGWDREARRTHNYPSSNGKGLHAIFTVPFELDTLPPKLAPGVDLKGMGKGYVIMPASELDRLEANMLRVRELDLGWRLRAAIKAKAKERTECHVVAYWDDEPNVLQRATGARMLDMWADLDEDPRQALNKAAYIARKAGALTEGLARELVADYVRTTRHKDRSERAREGEAWRVMESACRVGR